MFAPASFFPELFESQMVGLPTARAGINGRATYQGASAVNIPIDLWTGSPYSIIRTMTTGADGGYQFTDAPSLAAGKVYYARYQNSSDPNFVAISRGFILTSYTVGSSVAGGDFDIANIPQMSPANGATISFPYTFQWTKRNVPSDNYTLEIWDNNDYWSSGSIGYVDQYTLNSLPAGLSLGVSYWWDLAVNENGVYCYSFDQNRVVVFS